MHSSSFAFINQFIITACPRAALSLPSCLYGGLCVSPGAYGDIGVVTLGFMRHVMVCVITVFTPQCVSVCFCSAQRPTTSEHLHDSYSARACFPVVVIKGWTCYPGTLLRCCLFVFQLPPSVCESMCVFVRGRVSETDSLIFVVWSNLMWLGSTISIYASV